MEQFNYEIQNEDEKKLLVLLFVLGIFFGFIPFIIALFFMKDKFNNTLLEVIRNFCNFEIIIFLIVFLIGIVPIVGLLTLLISPVVFVINAIILFMAMNSLSYNRPISIPVFFKIF